MAARKRGRKRKAIVRAPAPSPTGLTRKEVARRELVHAIREFFNDDDRVVVHLLGSASLAVAVPVLRAKGIKPLHDHFEELVREEYRDSWREMANEPYNFFKHGGANPEEELASFDPRLNDMLLWQASTEYMRAFGDVETEMAILLAWHAASYPNLLTDEGKMAYAPMLQAFEDIYPHERKRRARELLAEANRERARRPLRTLAPKVDG